MVLSELYILNRALDGKDIYSLPSFSTLKMSEMKIELVKDKMIDKQILETTDSFAEEGVRYTKKIRDFKDACKYVHMMGFTLGLLEDNTAVLVRKNIGNKEDFVFSRVEYSDSAHQLLEVYPFLQKEYASNIKVDEVKMSISEVHEKYKIELQNSLRLVTQETDLSKERTDELIFENDNILYLYNCKENTLYSKTSSEVLMILKERMTI